VRNPARIRRILNKLETAWAADPELRFGQLVGNLEFELGGDLNPLPLWVIEDESFEQSLDVYLHEKGLDNGWKS